MRDPLRILLQLAGLHLPVNLSGRPIHAPTERQDRQAGEPTAEGQRFKSAPEILAECATVGITPDTPVYLYCFKGARASNTFLALKEAGVKDVKMYFGSWNEWSRDPALPIEEGYPAAR